MTDGLMRTPDDWARDWGWISNRRAKTMARKLRDVIAVMEGALDGDEGMLMWSRELERIAKQLDKEAPAARRRRLGTTRFDS